MDTPVYAKTAIQNTKQPRMSEFPSKCLPVETTTATQEQCFPGLSLFALVHETPSLLLDTQTIQAPTSKQPDVLLQAKCAASASGTFSIQRFHWRRWIKKPPMKHDTVTNFEFPDTLTSPRGDCKLVIKTPFTWQFCRCAQVCSFLSREGVISLSQASSKETNQSLPAK